jgi:histidyl-tRNA synthetase
MQLCGGGRYDDLVTALGGRHTTPAVGFAYGIERVVAAGALPVPEPAAAILVAASDDDSHPYALEVARRLRDAGHAACVDVRQRSVAANLRDALRRDAAVLVLVGAEECARGEVVWRDLASRHERRIPLDELARGVPHA